MVWVKNPPSGRDVAPARGRATPLNTDRLSTIHAADRWSALSAPRYRNRDSVAARGLQRQPLFSPHRSAEHASTRSAHPPLVSWTIPDTSIRTDIAYEGRSDSRSGHPFVLGRLFSTFGYMRGRLAPPLGACFVTYLNAGRAATNGLQCASVMLPADRARAPMHALRSDDKMRRFAKICRRVNGIALAIELATARVKVLATRELAQKVG